MEPSPPVAMDADLKLRGKNHPAVLRPWPVRCQGTPRSEVNVMFTVDHNMNC